MRKDIPGRRTRFRHRILENNSQFGILTYEKNSGNGFEKLG